MASDWTVYHVAPDASSEKWLVTQEGQEGTREFRRKAEAALAAKLLAIKQEPSQVKFHTRDGNTEFESTYTEGLARSPA